MTSPTATTVAAPVEGTARCSRRSTDSFAVTAPNRARRHSEGAVCRRRVVSFVVSLLASTCVALPLSAQPPARAAAARLSVSVHVVSSCAIDSHAANGARHDDATLQVRCSHRERAVTETSAVQTVGEGASAQRFVVTSVSF